MVAAVILYFRNVGAALSQLANALIGGDPDETLSGRVGKRYRAGRMPLWAKLIARVTGKKHIAGAVEEDEGSKALYNDRT